MFLIGLKKNSNLLITQDQIVIVESPRDIQCVRIPVRERRIDIIIRIRDV